MRIGAVGLSGTAPPTRLPWRGSRDNPVAYGLLAPWLLGIVFLTIGFSGRPIHLAREENATAPLALRTYPDARSGSGVGGMLATSVVSPMPPLLIFLAGRRRLLRASSTTTGIG